jgi:uncharacterized protein (DUF2336 family)
MFKLWIVVLTTLPFQVFIFWAAGWCVVDTLRERRIARVAAAEARALPRGANPSAGGERVSSWFDQGVLEHNELSI